MKVPYDIKEKKIGTDQKLSLCHEKKIGMDQKLSQCHDAAHLCTKLQN